MIKAGNNNNYKSCSDCGITHTPLWRGGPLGPKTMCNACGIRWKRANQSGKNKQHSHDKTSKAEYPSDEEKTEYDSAEELLALSDPENSRHSPRDSADTNESTKKRYKSMKKKPLHSAARNSKPYSRTPLNNRDLENEAEDSMLILQQAAEEFDRLGDVPADEPSSTGSSLNGSANASPTPIDMRNGPKQEDVKDQMNQLFSEVMALREEVQKRDAIIDMYKSTSSHCTSSSLGRSPQELPPVIAH